jgi:hypothetical protein
LLSAFNKVEKSKNYEEFNNLIEQIKTFNKDNPILKISENNYSAIKDIQWNEWKKEIKGTISALREECYRIENSTKLKAINEAIIQRCQDLQNNQRRVINSLTNNWKKSIKIDRIMVTTEQNKYIHDRPEEVNKRVEDYYTKAFGRRKANFKRLNKSWKDQYEPREYIE